MYHRTIAKKHKDAHSHDHEHKVWSRRSFLQALGIGSTGSLMLAGSQLSASSVSPLAMALNKSDNDNVLVLIRLSGGNDGLNTIVPVYDFDTYAGARPSIYHKQRDLITLDNDFAMPNYMQPLESMWGDGMMKVVHGVGYEGQNLSHFKSSDIWATANTNYGDALNQGWFGKYFKENYQDFLLAPPENPLAIQIGSVGNLIFSDEDAQFAFLVSNPGQLESIAKNGTQFNVNDLDLSCKSGQQQEFLRATSNSTYIYSGVISDAYKATSNRVEYSDNKIADQLAIIARLIKGNLGTKVFMVTLNGFDTHANQPERHMELMGDLSKAVKDFYTDLEETGHHEKVLGMTFSEFGRRFFENGSNGTDHGAASPTMFFGPALNGNGFVGEHPDIDNLDRNKNLQSTTDFRSLYASVLSQWLCIDQPSVDSALSGSFDTLDLGFSCGAEAVVPTPIEEVPGETQDGFTHMALYSAEGKPSIALNVDKAQHVDIQLYNILGQRIGTIKNSFMTEGSYTFDIDESLLDETLTAGEYIYRVTTAAGASSKIILVK